jgi:type III secretion protein U
MSEKTEPPTPKKLRDAREKGNLLKSTEIVSTVVMLAGLLALYVIATDVPKRFQMALDELVAMIRLVDLGTHGTRFAYTLAIEVLMVVGIVYAAILISIFITNIGQIGLYLSASKFSQGLESLNPVTNAKNLFSKKTLTQFAVNFIKVSVILGVAWWQISLEERSLAEKIYLCRLDTFCGLQVVASLGFRLLMWMTCAMVPIAAADWLIQRHFYMKDLMMSIDEVHREYKEQEGSPEMKGHRRQVAHEIVHEDPAPKARSASVVVRNPTHVAVALRFEPDVVPLPYVICKGTDQLAARIIREAELHGVPTFEDIPLARGLNDACAEGEHVPTNYIEPVARVIRWLYLNYPDKVFTGDQRDTRESLINAGSRASSYREGSTYGTARTLGNREPH